MEERGKGKEWKFHRGVEEVHLSTKRGADRDTKVIGEAGRKGRAGWIGMDPAPK